MPDNHRLLEFALASLLLILIPGPATLYILARGRDRARRGYIAAAGVITGDLVLITLAGLGFAALLARWPLLLTALQLIGALYLAYLGLSLLRSTPALTAPLPPTSRTFLGGLAITLTNPKPLLFFGTFLGSFVAADAPSRLTSFYLLGAVFELLNLLYFTTLLLLAAHLTRLAPARFTLARFHRFCGALLLVIAALMLANALRHGTG